METTNDWILDDHSSSGGQKKEGFIPYEVFSMISNISILSQIEHMGYYRQKFNTPTNFNV